MPHNQNGTDQKDNGQEVKIAVLPFTSPSILSCTKLGREAAGSNTIYTFSCSLENRPSEQAKTLKDHWKAVRHLLTPLLSTGFLTSTPVVISAHLITVAHKSILNSNIPFEEI